MRDAEQTAWVRTLVEAEPGPAGSDASGADRWLERLCRTATRTVPASGAGVSLMTEEGVGAVAATSDPLSRRLEDLQFSLLEGPCLDAFITRRPSLAADLDDRGPQRWPVYAPAVVDLGVHAVFAFPLQIGMARLGVLDLYRRRAGSLSPSGLTLALTFAEVALDVLLEGQARSGSERLPAGLDRAPDSHAIVYQAQGMVMVDLGISLVDAMARLRAHSFTTGRHLHRVADDVVAGRLRLEPDR